MYRYGADGAPTFIEAAASTGEELHALLQTVIARFMKMNTRRGVLVEEIGQTWLAEPDTNGEEARTVRPLLGEADVRHAKPVLPRSVCSRHLPPLRRDTGPMQQRQRWFNKHCRARRNGRDLRRLQARSVFSAHWWSHITDSSNRALDRICQCMGFICIRRHARTPRLDEPSPDRLDASSPLHGFERDGPFLRFTVFLVGEVRRIMVAFCESKPWLAMAILFGGGSAAAVAKAYLGG